VFVLYREVYIDIAWLQQTNKTQLILIIISKNICSLSASVNEHCYFPTYLNLIEHGKEMFDEFSSKLAVLMA